jgi:hypothetical protein
MTKVRDTAKGGCAGALARLPRVLLALNRFGGGLPRHRSAAYAR